ncbi:diphthamide biosynthesis protein 4 [Colletotrichum spaethianum]|uniref:Diphthamide biosynthesis protein 4 n=1 Tax=Colletotrichum spaethianum TaxID=700344 RepID=A0AA37NUH5_9PEZI|nr:diphthamide biosynthesis protein 4 [Colletotrichum spaethianum]GKT42037.1 diphthamide biosynthesis protein 4 [Colletotrichum spaethianum]
MSPSPAEPGEGHTHYTILGITRKLLQEQPVEPQQIIKRAYHRALLQNHPDKYKGQAPSTSSTSHNSQNSNTVFTIDQISTAYKILSDSKSKTEYDRSLDLAPNNQGLKRGEQVFQTGIENVDLDDLKFDESDGPDAECWYRSCRCGNPRGFLFTEADLEEAGENGELLVGCQDCSLWMKVHFAIVSED